VGQVVRSGRAPAPDVLAERLQALKANPSGAPADAPDSAGAPADAPDGGDAAAPPAEKPNIFVAALEESRLISWPAVPSVAKSTAAVMAIVIASTVTLLLTNSLLATASAALFG
jgi:preprotein translocase subunit SecE